MSHPTIIRELIGGPQDGARVHSVGGELPNPIHVGPAWLADGFAAWSREPCERFPARYELSGNDIYVFQAWQSS